MIIYYIVSISDNEYTFENTSFLNSTLFAKLFITNNLFPILNISAFKNTASSNSVFSIQAIFQHQNCVFNSKSQKEVFKNP